MMVQAQLDALRALVEGKTIECPATDIPAQTFCDFCQGAGRIPDPRYAPLLAVLRGYVCPTCENGRWCPPNVCDSCGGSGFLPRDVSHLPKGAVSGSVKAVVSEQAAQEKVHGWWTRLLIRLDTHVYFGGDPDGETIAIVSRAVQEEP